MTDHKVGTREEWLAARKELLAREKEHTRRSDELARERQELPWVRIEKDYSFDTDDGTKTLAQLFDGHSQLIVYHFMLGPEYEAGCPSCSAIADGFNGFHVHMASRADAKLMAVSRAPLEKLQAFKRRMGWTFDWASSFGSDFNYDYASSLKPEQFRGGGEYNFASMGDRSALLEVDSGPMFETARATGATDWTFDIVGMYGDDDVGGDDQDAGHHVNFALAGGLVLLQRGGVRGDGEAF